MSRQNVVDVFVDAPLNEHPCVTLSGRNHITAPHAAYSAAITTLNQTTIGSRHPTQSSLSVVCGPYICTIAPISGVARQAIRADDQRTCHNSAATRCRLIHANHIWRWNGSGDRVKGRDTPGHRVGPELHDPTIVILRPADDTSLHITTSSQSTRE